MTAPAFPQMIRSTLGRLLEAALARVVALDPDFSAQLSALEGRRLELALSAPALALSATVRDGRFVIGPAEAAAAADLSVRASPGALLAQLLPGAAGAAAPAGRITISGDAELARRLQQLVQRYDPDVEEAFARVFGDVAGVQIARALKRGLDWSRRTASGFARDAGEFLTEENRSVVAAAELGAFHDDVDAIRDDVDRFERRVGRLRDRVPGH
ncbi:ubiquinone biosynthesis accessory factor UbiJ [Chiayiivirga flava]|uniref:Ubiquinone biosynthesis accessory factor UbiJ n=1 Tax=Chiayiivirga flava TaxID=659595 RepID=A0A7W8D6Q3_9GAMM|nr:SCP2 sterol-binding domain-containing protein [Chiayiivirga flava]MBB5207707.1 ubiquinone biosynthesis protein UbiJ [Chiayiivirga flava]